MNRWKKYALLPLMCLVLLGIVSCGELLSNLVVVPFQGVRAFLNLNESFFLTQTDAGGVDEAGDLYSAGLFTGDYDGDGFTDLVVGATGKGGGAGIVYVYFGSEAGVTSIDTTGGSPRPPFSVTQANAGEVGEAGDQFGATMVTGDFDGDKIDDLVVGAPGDDPGGGGSASGSVFVFFGRADGTFETGCLYTQTDAGGEPNEAGDEFGAALATGDFDNDTLSDLVVGAPGDSPARVGTPPSA